MSSAYGACWYKAYVGLVDNPKWGEVAERAETTRPNAIAVWLAAMESVAKHGGLLDHFSLDLVARGLGIAIAEVKRIWEVLRKLKAHDGHQLRGWVERQAPYLCRRIGEASRRRSAAKTAAAEPVPPAPPPDRQTDRAPPVVPPSGGDGTDPDIGATEEVAPGATVIALRPQIEILPPLDGGRPRRESRSEQRDRARRARYAEAMMRYGVPA